MKRTVHPLRRKLFCRFCERLYRIETSGEENLEGLRKQLKAGSAIVCWNHICDDDAVNFLTPLLSQMGKDIKRLVIPVSRRLWDLKKSPPSALVMRLAPLIDLEILPIVQHYERALYPPEHIFSLDRQFVKTAHQILATPGGVILIAPEGHRSEDGRLQPPQKGVEFLLKIAERENSDTKLMPVGIEPRGKYSRGFVNLGRRFAVHFGPLLTSDEVKGLALEFNTFPAQVVMRKIASLLPDRMWNPELGLTPLG